MYYTQGLFFETAEDKSSVLYTLKNEDHLGYPSLYRLYIAAGDLTEYRFATTALAGWEHWQVLQKCKWFAPYISAWRLELEVKLKSEALLKLSVTAAGDGREAFTANKYLLEWSRKPAGKKNSPEATKAAILDEAHQRASEDRTVASDLERLKSLQ